MLLKDVFNPKLLYKGRVTGCIFPKYYIRQYDRNIIHVYHLIISNCFLAATQSKQ